MNSPNNQIRKSERLDRSDPAHAAAIRSNPPAILTVPEAAAFLACSPRKIRADIAERRLTVVRLGGSVRIRLTDLQRALEKFAVRAA